MKMNGKTFALAMMVAMNLISMSAKANVAEIIESRALSAIESSNSLKTNLESMGYQSTSEAAKKFAEVALQAEEQGLDVNLGTLAICGKGTLQTLEGVQTMLCTTLFNAYEVRARLSGPGVALTLSAEGIYFYNQTPYKKACYIGGRFEAGFQINVNFEGSAQVSCNGKRKYKKGFFVALGMGLGASAAISKTLIEVTHSGSYFDL